MSKPFFQMILLFNGLLAMIACSLFSSASSTTTPTAEPQVVATYWTAELVGELVEVEGCIRVNDRNSDTSYLLVWPPDIAATVENDTVRVVTGILTGNRKEVVLHLGEMVRLSGGETKNLGDQLRQTSPANCPGPYWVVGIEVGPFEPK
jgi:hypothetical protein